jgi:subtilisin family serine protease
MPTRDPSLIRVAVFAANEREEETARAILSRADASDVHQYSGMVTGWATREGIADLARAGLMYEESHRLKPRERRGTSDRSRDRLERFLESATGLPAQEPDLPRAYLVEFRGPMRPEWMERLRRENLSYLGKTGVETYRMMLTPAEKQCLESLDFFLEATPEQDVATEAVVEQWETAQSAVPQAAEGGLLGADAPAQTETATYDAIVYREQDLERLVEILAKDPGVTIRERYSDTVRFDAPKNSPLLAAITRMPIVKLLADYNPPSLFCNSSRVVMGLCQPGSPPVARFPWNGKGVRVGVLDSGADTTHPDLTAAVVKTIAVPNSLPSDTIGHGTHVAGILAGRGVASQGAVQGVAPGSELVVTAMVDAAGKLLLPLNYKDIFGEVLAEGVTILNLSWGWPIGGAYDQGSVQVDRLAYEHPEILFVIAAGNSGEAKDGQHKFKTIGAPASAKNAITAGAWTGPCDNIACPVRMLTWQMKKPAQFPKPPAANEPVCPNAPGTTAAFSSRGPTDYESIKPDVLAPGAFIESAKAKVTAPGLFEKNCITQGPDYACSSGTSVAAPFISGCAAILRQYLRDVRATPNPPSALLKALLIAAASPVPAPSPERAGQNGTLVGFPDFDQGFGLVDLGTLLPHAAAPASRRVAFTAIANDSEEALASRQPPNALRKSFRVYEVTVPPGSTGRLRVVLCWTDLPGVFLQNNLQLDVLLPDGSVAVGNQGHLFRKDPIFDDLDASTGIPFDKRNNVEVVHIEKPPPGNYRIRVVAWNTPFPAPNPMQGYALVVSGELDSDTLQTS